MYTVRQLMQEKAESGTFSVPSNISVYDALKVMADKNVGAVVVVDHEQMVGIFSERDFARMVVLSTKCTLDSPLSEIMTREMVTVHPEQSLEECMQLMNDHHIRHLPVLDRGRLVGMISIGDLVHAIVSGKEEIIESLERYISGQDYGK